MKNRMKPIKDKSDRRNTKTDKRLDMILSVSCVVLAIIIAPLTVANYIYCIKNYYLGGHIFLVFRRIN